MLVIAKNTECNITSVIIKQNEIGVSLHVAKYLPIYLNSVKRPEVEEYLKSKVVEKLSSYWIGNL